MADQAHRRTNKRLAELEKQLTQLYGSAHKELSAKTDAYFESFAKRDAEQLRLLGEGRITREYYTQWRLNQIGRGARFEAMRDEMSERMTRINEIAAAYINDATPGIYSLNRNYAAYTIEQVAGDVGFTLFDEQTVRKLAVEAPDLMPFYPPKRAIKRGIDLAWGKRQITAQVTQSILQGESVKHMADRLQSSIRDMNRTSAVRAARTAVTAAQNAGRMDSYAAADKLGIKVRKRWIATKDGRTRHDHGMADGQTVEWDKPFGVGGVELMFPADPAGPENQTYNCRCTMRTVEKKGIEAEPRQMRVRDPSTGKNVVVNEMSYSEWERWKTNLQNKHADGIIVSGKGEDVTIQRIELPIEQRRTGKGNPNAVLTYGVGLNNRQKALLEALPDYDSKVIVRKDSVKMTDLSALTAETGAEFAMFTKGGERLIIRGDARKVNINEEAAIELSGQGYKWSGHTHPGDNMNCLTASYGDVRILNCFKQKVAYIYNSKGQYLDFGKE